MQNGETTPIEQPAGDASTPAPLAFSAMLTAISQPVPAANPAAAAVPAEVATPAIAVSEPPVAANKSVDQTKSEPGTSRATDVATNSVAKETRDSSHDSSSHDTEHDAEQPTPVHALAAITSSAEDFSRSVAAPSVPAGQVRAIEAQAPTSLSSAADTMRAAESAPAAQVAPAAPAAPVQEIAVRIARPDAPAVDLHVVDRAGEIHVAVRTPDTELQTSLRQDLGTLTNSLERAGFHAETFVPRAASGAQTNLREDRQNHQGSSGRGGSP
ncbi:MAG TPA: hypothetical protein VIX35_10695, partial [Vicinamibacterales bacterium]